MSPRLHWLAAIILFISVFVLAATAQAQDLTNWTEEGMRMTDGVDSTPLLLPDGRVRLYFGSNTMGGIVSATSADGLNFTYDAGVRRTFSIYNGGYGLVTRFVPVPGGGVRMFYSTGNGGGGIASAISSDGLNFTSEPGFRVAWSDLGATNGTDGGTVVTLPDGTYRMYIGLTGAPGTFAKGYIKSAASTDMINWTIESGVRIGPGSTLSGGANHPFAMTDGNGIVTVFYWDDLFLIAGKSQTGIKYATSMDGINFSTETVTNLNSGTPNCQACFYGDPSVYPLPDGRLRIYFNRVEADRKTNTLWSATSNELAPGTAALISAVLPSSRSVQVGATATAFATIINAGLGAGLDCTIAPAGSFAGSFSYQATNSATNAPTGSPNAPVTIRTGPGAAQSFVISLTPSSVMSAGDFQLSFACLNGAPAPSSSGLNTLYFSASTTPTPDVVALGATPTHDGILDITGASGVSAFAVATANVGATGAITATADTGSTPLPVALTICQTNPSTAACLSPAAATATATIAANATPTFSIFAQGSGTIAFAPGTSRIFVRFKDTGGITRGSTSVAVRTQ